MRDPIKHHLVVATLAGPMVFASAAQAYILDGRTWNAGNPALITFSLATGNYATAEGGAGGNIVRLGSAPFINTALTSADMEIQVRAAFADWAAKVPGLFFFEVVDSGLAFDAAGATGDIRVGGHDFDGVGGTLAHGYYPPPNGVTAAGDIHLDVTENWVIGYGVNIDVFQVVAHEIGHAIGLMHTDVPGSLMEPFYSEAFVGAQADDIAGAIDLFDGGGLGGGPMAPEPMTATLGLMALWALGFTTRRRAFA